MKNIWEVWGRKDGGKEISFRKLIPLNGVLVWVVASLIRQLFPQYNPSNLLFWNFLLDMSAIELASSFPGYQWALFKILLITFHILPPFGPGFLMSMLLLPALFTWLE